MRRAGTANPLDMQNRNMTTPSEEEKSEKSIQAERNKSTLTVERVRNGFILRSHLGWFVYNNLDQVMHKIEEQLKSK